jgi:hypothetical protein
MGKFSIALMYIVPIACSCFLFVFPYTFFTVKPIRSVRFDGDFVQLPRMILKSNGGGGGGSKAPTFFWRK